MNRRNAINKDSIADQAIEYLQKENMQIVISIVSYDEALKGMLNHMINTRNERLCIGSGPTSN